MAMGVVSDKDFDSEFNKLKEREESSVQSTPTPIPTNAIVVDVNKGRGKGNVEVPNTLRNLIGTTAIEDGRHEALELGKSFGISPSSVSAYANGAVSTSTYDDRPNAPVITSSKDRIARKARGRLLMALRHITPEKLQDTKVRDLAGIAKDMAAVSKSMEEIDNPLGKGNTGPTFVFYSPQFRKEEVFDVVQAKE